jgi:hypothetical protein
MRYCTVPPGHNAWVVGVEPVVGIDFTGLKDYGVDFTGLKDYAKE